MTQKNKNIKCLILTLIGVLLYINDSYSQIHVNGEYQSLIDSAHTAIKSNQDTLALKYYERAFSISQIKQASALYEVSSVCARLQLTDRSFMYLNWAIDKGLSYYDHFKTNKHYIQFKDDPRYNYYLELLRVNDSLYTFISDKFTKIYNTDQSIRKYYFSRLNEGVNKNSEEAKYLLEVMNIIDAYNLLEIEKIIEKYGILGQRLKTTEARQAISTVYLHAPKETQKIILKKIEKAVNEGEITAANYAYLEDRIMVDDTGYQKYGSQYKVKDNEIILYPLIDPEKVDVYRKEVGLDTLEEYLNYVKQRLK